MYLRDDEGMATTSDENGPLSIEQDVDHQGNTPVVEMEMVSTCTQEERPQSCGSATADTCGGNTQDMEQTNHHENNQSMG